MHSPGGEGGDKNTSVSVNSSKYTRFCCPKCGSFLGELRALAVANAFFSLELRIRCKKCAKIRSNFLELKQPEKK